MRCRDVHEKLEDLAAQELTLAERAQVEAHLKTCSACRAALAKARRLEELLLVAPVPPVPEGFAERVLARARTEQAAATRPKPASRSERPAWRRIRASVGTAAAMAAGLLLGMSMGFQTWESGRSPSADPSGDLLAAAGLESLAASGGDSLAEAYLSLTKAGNR